MEPTDRPDRREAIRQARRRAVDDALVRGASRQELDRVADEAEARVRREYAARRRGTR